MLQASWLSTCLSAFHDNFITYILDGTSNAMKIDTQWLEVLETVDQALVFFVDLAL